MPQHPSDIHVRSYEFWERVAKALDIPSENIHDMKVHCESDNYLRVDITFLVPVKFLDDLIDKDNT